MSVVISGSLVLADTVSGGGIINANNPLIGWHNLAAVSPISATSSAPGFPPGNLGNPATYLRWTSAGDPPVVDEYVRIDVNAVEAKRGSFAAYDCVVIITDHKTFDYDAMVAEADLVVDTRNAIRKPAPNVFKLGAARPDRLGESVGIG